MKTLKKTVMLTLIASVFLLFSCAKDGKDGAPGPAGPAGNANVKSQIFDVNSWNWSSNQTNLNATIISNTIVNSGSVMVYMETSAYSGVWAALPLSFSGTEVIYAYSASNVNIVANPQPTSLERFKVVAVASSARIANPNVDYTNYEEVKATFNLKD